MRILRRLEGLTLLEVLITALVMGIGFVAILTIFSFTTNLSRQTRSVQLANKFSQTELDYYRALGYNSLSNGVTDVTSSLPGSLGGTASACSSGTGKSACVSVVIDRINSTADSVGNIGYYTSTAIGSDGYPIISYQDAANSDLKITKCGDLNCLNGNTITTLDSVGSVGDYTSIAMGTDGLPVISYHDTTNGDLKVAKCGNAACSSGNTLTTVDSVGSVGDSTSIAIGTDGLPVISYRDTGNTDLKVAKCGNASCSGGNTITTVDSVTTVGSNTSIAIGTDGFPVISYYDSSVSQLKVAKCGNAACSSGNTLTTVASNGGGYVPITIGSDGLPVIAYYNSSTQGVSVAKCGNAACSSGNTLTNVDSGNGIVGNGGISIAIQGNPIIAYLDLTNGHLKVAKCGNAACSSGNTLTTADSGNTVGSHTSIAIGIDGLPVIGYYDQGNGDLKATRCGSGSCGTGGESATVSIVVKWMEGSIQRRVVLSTTVSKNGL